MTIQDLGSAGELIGAIATVATLFYLATQIRSSTRAVRTASAQSVHESFSTWYRMLACDAGLTDTITKGLRDYTSLDESEKGRFVATSMALLLCTQDAYIKWREGSLSAELWTGWEFVTMNLVISPGGRLFWSERSYMFGAEFQAYVEQDLMQRAAHPAARPLGAFSLGNASEVGGNA